MKSILTIAALLLLLSCGKTSEQKLDGQVDTSTSESPNLVLYDQVIDIHDEVMPKMDELYSYKKNFQEQLNSADLKPERKLQLEQMIGALDSSSNAMMNWMHHFNPLPDSVDEEKARAYLETEMESIKKVRDLTKETLEKAKALKATN